MPHTSYYAPAALPPERTPPFLALVGGPDGATLLISPYPRRGSPTPQEEAAAQAVAAHLQTIRPAAGTWWISPHNGTVTPATIAAAQLRHRCAARSSSSCGRHRLLLHNKLLARYSVTIYDPLLRNEGKASMVMSNAERQAAYRRRRPTAGENGEREIRTWVTTGTALALERQARHHGITQRAMLERLITAADERITRRLDPDTPAWASYFTVTP